MKRRAIYVALSLLLAPFARSAAPDDALFDLLKCDRFAASAERLACFDGLVARYRAQIGAASAAAVPGAAPVATAPSAEPVATSPSAEPLARTPDAPVAAPAEPVAATPRAPAAPRAEPGAQVATVPQAPPGAPLARAPQALVAPPVADVANIPAEARAAAAEPGAATAQDAALRARVAAYYAAQSGTQAVARAPGVDDLQLPFATTITAFVSSRPGEFRLRIREGWEFRGSDGRQIVSRTLEGRPAILQKNLLGQWRMRVEGEPALIALRPVAP